MLARATTVFMPPSCFKFCGGRHGLLNTARWSGVGPEEVRPGLAVNADDAGGHQQQFGLKIEPHSREPWNHETP